MGMTQPDKFMVRFQTPAYSPGDGAVLYMTQLPVLSLTTSTVYGCFIVPFTGMIRQAYIASYAATAAGTGEAWEWFVRNVTAGTEVSIQSLSVANALREWTNTDLAIPVTKGDKILLKTTTPAWVTNPEGFQATGLLLLEV